MSVRQDFPLPQACDRLPPVRTQTSHRRRLLPRALPLVLAWLVGACTGNRSTDLADFWQEALPDPIAVFDPPLAPPTMMRMSVETFAAHIIDVHAFVRGPAEATGAETTVVLLEPSGQERRLHLRLAHGAVMPLHRNEAVEVAIYSRLDEAKAIHRVIVVSGRRPLGTGADFRPVLVVAHADDVLPQDALPRVLTGLTRTDQVAYRESAVAHDECIRTVTHFVAQQPPDPRAPGKRRQPLFPGAHVRRTEGALAYEVTLHDARRVVTPKCPELDESVFAWSAVWVDGLQPLKLPPSAVVLGHEATATHALEMPGSATPTDARSHKPPSKAPKKSGPRPAGQQP